MSVSRLLQSAELPKLKRWLPALAAAVVASVVPLKATEINDLPKAVQASVAMLSKNGSASALSCSVVAGESFFNVQISGDGSARIWSFDENGVPVNVSLNEKELPPPVFHSLQAQAKGARILAGLQRSFEEGKPLYEAKWRVGKSEFSTFVHGDGSLAAREVDKAELPPAVKKQIVGKWSPEQVDRCFRSQEKGVAYFTVTIVNAQNPRWITFDSEGEIAEEEERLAWSSVPEKVCNAVQQKLHGSEHVRVLKKTEDEEETYEIWALTPERMIIFWVDPDGEVYEHPPAALVQ